MLLLLLRLMIICAAIIGEIYDDLCCYIGAINEKGLGRYNGIIIK